MDFQFLDHQNHLVVFFLDNLQDSCSYNHNIYFLFLQNEHRKHTCKFFYNQIYLLEWDFLNLDITDDVVESKLVLLDYISQGAMACRTLYNTSEFLFHILHIHFLYLLESFVANEQIEKDAIHCHLLPLKNIQLWFMKGNTSCSQCHLVKI